MVEVQGSVRVWEEKRAGKKRKYEGVGEGEGRMERRSERGIC